MAKTNNSDICCYVGMVSQYSIKVIKLGFHIANLSFLVFLLVGLYSCDKTPQAASNENEDGEELSPEYLEQKAKEIEEKTANRFLGEKYRATPLEDVTDTSSYDMPRLQFVWGNEDLGFNRPLIWSVKVDGTDLRKVLDENTLYADFKRVYKIPKRSPNRRYLAAAMQKRALSASVVVFDLEKNVRKEVFTGSVLEVLGWSPNGELLYFYYVGDYYVWGQKVDEIKKYESYGINVILNNGNILSIRKRKNDKIEKKLLDSRFNLISSKKLNIPYSQYMETNQYGDIAVYSNKDRSVVFQKLDGSNDIIYRENNDYVHNLAFDSENNFYYSKTVSVAKGEIHNKVKREVISLPKPSIISLSLYNEKRHVKHEK